MILVLFSLGTAMTGVTGLPWLMAELLNVEQQMCGGNLNFVVQEDGLGMLQWKQTKPINWDNTTWAAKYGYSRSFEQWAVHQRIRGHFEPTMMSFPLYSQA